MAKLIDIGVKIPGSVPEGSPLELVYPTAYVVAARAAGGMFEGRAGALESDGWRRALAKTGNSVMRAYGGEVGDPLPPLVQLRVKPRGAGIKGLDWHIEGHPRDTGGGAWDGSRYGTLPGDVMATAGQVQSLSALLITGQQQQEQAQQALADIAQTTDALVRTTTAQIEATEAAGAQALTIAQAAGVEALQTAAPDVTYTYDAERQAATPPEGTTSYTLESRQYHKRVGADWQAVGSGVASAAEVAPLRVADVSDLATLPFAVVAGQQLIVGGDRGGRFTATATGNAPPVDNGIIFALPGGLVAKREREGRVRSRWYPLVPDGDLTLMGAGTDNGPVLEAFFNAINRYGGLIEIDAGIYRSGRRLPALGAKPFRLEAGGASLVFSVQDVGGPRLQVVSAVNWYANIGLIRQLGLPEPSRDITEGHAPDGIAPAGWGEPFKLRGDTPEAVYWRTHDDAGLKLTNCSNFELHINVDGARGMGLVMNNCQRGRYYGTVSRSLADGAHWHGGSSRSRVHLDVFNTGDDGVAFIVKEGEPPMLDNVLDVTVDGTFARGVVVSGTQNIHLQRADARNTYYEGVLVLAEALEGEPTLYTRIGAASAWGCCTAPDAVAVESAGVRIGYPNSGGQEMYTEIGSIRAINNHSAGVRLEGRYNRIGTIFSQGNAAEDKIAPQNELEVESITVIDGVGLRLDGTDRAQIGRITALRNSGVGVRFAGTHAAHVDRITARDNGDRGIIFEGGSSGNTIGEVQLGNNGLARPAGSRFQLSALEGGNGNTINGGRLERGASDSSGCQLLSPTHLTGIDFDGWDSTTLPLAVSPAALASSRFRRLRGGYGLQAGTNLAGMPYSPAPAFAHATEFTIAPFRTRVHITERGGAKLDGLNVRRADGKTTDYVVVAPNVRTLDLEPGDVLSVYRDSSGVGSIAWLWEISE